jgi:hypothetical protein
MKVSNNISIHIEGGYLQISGQIPVVNASDEIEPFIRELKFQLFGEGETENVRTPSLAPKDLDEKDAAKYIGRSVSFLRCCRYNGRNKEGDRGPKYTRVSPRCIRYPVHELDKWRENHRLYGACCEEQEVQPVRSKAGKSTPTSTKVK